MMRKTGITKYTILWELESIVFPWSYGIDAMHLFYQNVALQMRDHWAGVSLFHILKRRPSVRPISNGSEKRSELGFVYQVDQ